MLCRVNICYKDPCACSPPTQMDESAAALSGETEVERYLHVSRFSSVWLPGNAKSGGEALWESAVRASSALSHNVDWMMQSVLAAFRYASSPCA